MLRRLPDSRYSEVLPAWRGETVVLLGGGPSLTREQVMLVWHATVAGWPLRCIAVNNAYQFAPWADVLYFADWAWLGWQTCGFGGLKCSIQNFSGSVPDDVHVLRNRDHPLNGYGLSLDPTMLVTGRNGGFQALNLAVLAGATTVILLGYDGQKAADGRTHFHAGHPRHTPAEAYLDYKESFRVAAGAIKAAGVRVVNASPGSAIDAFEQMELHEALASCDKLA